MSENYLRDDSNPYPSIIPPPPNPNTSCQFLGRRRTQSLTSKISKWCFDIIIWVFLYNSDLNDVFIQLICACGTAVYVIRIYQRRKNHKIGNIYCKIILSYSEIYCSQKIQFRSKTMYGAKLFDYEL